jgi:hypothetical protein
LLNAEHKKNKNLMAKRVSEV